MHTYSKTDPFLWTGRKSGQQLYLHEKVLCIDLNSEQVPRVNVGSWAILGYACDEGVKRNEGRIGAVLGPDSFPILLGGGHDMAYGHYNGIKKYLDTKGNKRSIGIINFDAHFDLRSNQNSNNSGTPFFQIAEECKQDLSKFQYLCLGIREDANNSALYNTARNLGVCYIEKSNFNLLHYDKIKDRIEQFTKEVDYIYTTIDLDGFSSAYAPGVSAASPMGFSPEIVLECLKIIMASKKMTSLDIAEMNPTYDIDQQTAKLAASLIHFVIHQSH
mgnify:CR=1 FL=1